MTYHNAVKYLSQAPDDCPEEIAGARLRRLWNLLGNPQAKLKYLRLAGSSGKTVCSEMLLSSFEGSEFQVGCLNMPLRAEPRENIRIGKRPLSFEDLAGFVGQIYGTVKSVDKTVDQQNRSDPSLEKEFTPTKHEILLSAALLAFQANRCHLCIIETSNLANDPTRFLPPPMAAAVCGTIPKQKQQEMQHIRSYICHGIREIVSAPQDQEAYHIISKACAAINCRLTIPTKAELDIQKSSLRGSEFCYRGKSYRLSLCGQFQITHAMVSLEILTMLARNGYPLSDEQIQAGFRSLKIPSKFEILSVMPTIIADSTHSPEAIETVCHSMNEFRPLIGTKLSLCLPQGPLVNHYLRIMREQGYDIHRLILSGDSVEAEDADTQDVPTVLCGSLRDTARTAIRNLDSDSILLISGTHTFTSEVRYEILKFLGF